MHILGWNNGVKFLLAGVQINKPCVWINCSHGRAHERAMETIVGKRRRHSVHGRGAGLRKRLSRPRGWQAACDETRDGERMDDLG